jgi:hypothetical protein
MNRNIFQRSLCALGLFAILLSACQGAATPQVNQQTQVAEAAQQTLTAVPLQPTSTNAPTDVPPTATTAPTATSAPTATQGPVMVGPTGFAANVNPLTGLTVSDPKILDRRPVMVKVANFPASGRPHAGLSNADMVFEYYIGEGMNRFVGLFYGQNAPKVGPIRSGRVIDAQLIPMYQGVLAFSGAYITVLNQIVGALGNRAISESDTTCPAICRDATIDITVNNVMADTAKFSELAQKNGADPKTRPNLDGMRFETVVPQGGKPATQVAIQFNQFDRGEWRYDTATGTYLRWIENVDANNTVTMIPLTDRNTKKQLAFNNVVVVFANHTEQASTIFVVDMNNNLTGRRALLFRDGQVYDGTWKSNGADKPISFFTKDGKALAFKPGNTWMAIMGVNSQVTDKTGNYQVQFSLP